MENERLRYLLTIEEEASISKAAERLFLSQPSLSKFVTSVENSIGFKIFKRSASGLIPTELGKRYLAYVRDSIALKNRMLDDIDRIREERKKHRIVFGLAYTRNAIAIPKKMKISLPDVQLRIRIRSEEELIDGLQDGSIDFALLTMPAPDRLPSGIRFKEVYTERILIAVPHDNPLSEKGIVREGEPWPYLEPALLRDQIFISSGRGTGLYDLTEAFFRAEEIEPDVRVVEDSVLAAKRFAEEGWGICFVTEEIANNDPTDRLRYFSTNDTLPLRHVGYAWNKQTETDPLRREILMNNIEALSEN